MKSFSASWERAVQRSASEAQAEAAKEGGAPLTVSISLRKVAGGEKANFFFLSFVLRFACLAQAARLLSRASSCLAWQYAAKRRLDSALTIRAAVWIRPGESGDPWRAVRAEQAEAA